MKLRQTVVSTTFARLRRQKKNGHWKTEKPMALLRPKTTSSLTSNLIQTAIFQNAGWVAHTSLAVSVKTLNVPSALPLGRTATFCLAMKAGGQTGGQILRELTASCLAYIKINLKRRRREIFAAPKPNNISSSVGAAYSQTISLLRSLVRFNSDPINMPRLRRSKMPQQNLKNVR